MIQVTASFYEFSRYRDLACIRYTSSSLILLAAPRLHASETIVHTGILSKFPTVSGENFGGRRLDPE